MSEATGRYEIEILRADGGRELFTASPDRTILEAADGRGIDMRYGCREGRCVSCTGRLITGDVEYITEPHALNDAQREAGFVLLCVATPVDDCLIDVGKDVLAEAFPHMWRGEGGRDYVDAHLKAQRALRDVVEADHGSSDPVAGPLDPYENLQQVREAYRRALESTTSKRDR